MNDLTRVAVIIPVYNGAEFLSRCLNSILAQTYANLTVLVVDDGSTDSSGQIADDYALRDPRVRVTHQSHAGVADARNTGLAQVKEPYVTFVDADDYVAPTYVATLLSLLLTNQTLMAMVGLRRLDERGKSYTHDQHGQRLLTTQEVLATMMIGDDPLTIALYAKLYRTVLFKGITFPVGHTSEDVAVMYQLLAQCPQIAVDLTPQYFYCYRQQSTSHAMDNFAAVVADDVTYHRQFVAQACQTYPTLREAGERWLLLIHLRQWLNGRRCRTNRQVGKDLWQYVKTHRRTVLRQQSLPRKQAILLRATYLGPWGFNLLWHLWCLFRKRHNM